MRTGNGIYGPSQALLLLVLPAPLSHSNLFSTLPDKPLLLLFPLSATILVQLPPFPNVSSDFAALFPHLDVSLLCLEVVALDAGAY